jgi:predicted nucleic acid-binding protein
MLAYADTSALVAYFYPNDVFAITVTRAAQREAPDFVYWPFLRFELRHNLRMLRGGSPRRSRLAGFARSRENVCAVSLAERADGGQGAGRSGGIERGKSAED